MTDTFEMKITATQAEWVKTALNSRVNIREFIDVTKADIHDLKGMRDRLSQVITEIENADQIEQINTAIKQLKQLGVAIPKELHTRLKALQGGSVEVKGKTGGRDIKTGVYYVEGHDPVEASSVGAPSKKLKELMEATGLNRSELNKEYFTPHN
ncbi:hypothetical protein EXA18_00575 [Vibrio cincinnatiensis]|uniref:hypothetical protein n=1 Tax=Vibrio cincinnatiensis TaxID=675 RepID=UPI001EDFDA88|nr:hypothetical protein [Vibrio cincinnatiensis]MCG3741977.1 hypothetical protein [Vibrio cincinnatiensis]